MRVKYNQNILDIMVMMTMIVDDVWMYNKTFVSDLKSWNDKIAWKVWCDEVSVIAFKEAIVLNKHQKCLCRSLEIGNCYNVGTQ